MNDLFALPKDHLSTIITTPKDYRSVIIKAPKRVANAPPSGKGAPIDKKPKNEVFKQETDNEGFAGPLAKPAVSFDEHCDGLYTHETGDEKEISSSAAVATAATAAARNPTTITFTAALDTSFPTNGPVQTTTDHNGNGQWAPSSIPASYQKYQPLNNYSNVNLLDYHFFYLNDWIFHSAKNVSVNLFQAGRKKNFGFMNNEFTMVYLPAKPDNLATWLECFNRGANIKPAGVEQEGYTHYTWQSVVTLPRSNFTQQLRKKYKCHEKRGFIDCPVIEDHSSYPAPLPVNLENMFPKIAALAGLRKDTRVPKGWISFSRDDMMCRISICKGNARSETRKSNRPKGLAFEGENQHEPVEKPLFLISGGVEIIGLHDLFCVVEGLLRTL